MNLETQLDDRIEKIDIDSNLIKNSLNLAKRDIDTAKSLLLDSNFDWAYAISYNGMLQAARALMFYSGYRPKGSEQHLTVIEYIKFNFSDKFTESELFLLNKSRKKRHLIVYEMVDLVSEQEAENSICLAKKFISKVENIIKLK
ncbi:MAG: HEPN domain-containing protein [archaeon]